MDGVLRRQIRGSKLLQTQQIDRSAQIQEGLFLVKIFEFIKNQEKFRGFGGGNTSHSVSTQALIPYDAGWVPIFTDRRREGEERDEHEQNERENEEGK